jgi:hypothetical protein
MEYADDVDFIDEERKTLDELLPIAARKLKKENLFMNEAKTEFTHVYLPQANEKTDDGKAIPGTEEWRKSNILGSQMFSSTDIMNRCIRGNLAFQSFWKMWIQGSRIPLIKKLRLYDATCVSMMLYNCNSWSSPKHILDKLDACHRKHLRTITQHRWPNSLISNKSLYTMCNTVPLSVRVSQQRWNTLGHVLRMPDNTTAQCALDFAVIGATKYKPRRGRH